MNSVVHLAPFAASARSRGLGNQLLSPLLSVLLFGLGFPFKASAQSQRFDAAAQFSTNSNPNGVWSYGFSGSLGAFTIVTNMTPWVGGMPAWGRSLGFPQSYPRIFKNTTGAQVDSGGVVLTNDWTGIHPGNQSDDQFGIIRFTAPVRGQYRIQAQFLGAESSGSGTTTDVHVLTNQAAVFNATISGFLTSAMFKEDTLYLLEQGGTVDFVVGNGGNGFNGDTTGVLASIELVESQSTLPRLRITFNSAGPVVLNWNSVFGVRYQVQVSTNLNSNWMDFSTIKTAVGSESSLIDLDGETPRKFYRLVVLP